MVEKSESNAAVSVLAGAGSSRAPACPGNTLTAARIATIQTKAATGVSRRRSLLMCSLLVIKPRVIRHRRRLTRATRDGSRDDRCGDCCSVTVRHARRYAVIAGVGATMTACTGAGRPERSWQAKGLTGRTKTELVPTGAS